MNLQPEDWERTLDNAEAGSDLHNNPNYSRHSGLVVISNSLSVSS